MSKNEKTIAQINERIKKGKAVVLNAREMAETVKKIGKDKAAKEVDVVTTGTFSPMCSSGLLINHGQPEPPLVKTSKVWLNGVPAYAGMAAVDAYIGATEPHKDDPLNKVYPGQFRYGGGHVIEDLVAGRTVRLTAEAYGTDCYPSQGVDRDVTLASLPFAELVNPRNCYQNYNVAINLGPRTIYTYMGPLKGEGRNVNFATAGCLSPLFNDPYFKTIGIGTRIFMGGGIGYVIGAGTQHVANPRRAENGIPLTPSGTLMLKGDLKKMQHRYVRGLSFVGYGCSLSLGVGIPIPILNPEIAEFTGVSDAEIMLPVKDYGNDYPNAVPRILQHVSYEELLTGKAKILDKEVDTVPMTSLAMSLEVADTLKDWILKGDFLLSEPVELIPAG